MAKVMHRFCLFLLVIMKSNCSDSALTELERDENLNLQCFNDYETIFCQFQPTTIQPNCSNYTLKLKERPSNCSFMEYGEQSFGQCLCRLHTILILYAQHNLTLWNGKKFLASQFIDVRATLKPKRPTITSVEEMSHGDVMVQWRTNHDKSNFIQTKLRFILKYRKEGEMEEVSRRTQVPSYDILSQDLEPGTTYVLSVTSYTDLSGLYSEPSLEKTFTTKPVSNTPTIVIAVLCIVAFVVASVAFGLYVWAKRKWWDTFYKYPKTLLTMAAGEQKVLMPQDMPMSPFDLEAFENGISEDKQWSKCLLPDTDSECDRHSSGISTGSSLEYGKTVPMEVNVLEATQEALRKALPQLALLCSASDDSAVPSCVSSTLLISDYNLSSSMENSPVHSPGHSGIYNKSYSIALPSSPRTVTSERPASTEQDAILNDPTYRPSVGAVPQNTSPDTPLPVIAVATQSDLFVSPVGSPHMQIDFSYQPCDIRPDGMGAPVSCVTTVQDDYESFTQAVRGGRHALSEEIPDVPGEEACVCDVNPCYMSHVDSGTSGSARPIDSDYQAFESLVGPPK